MASSRKTKREQAIQRKRMKRLMPTNNLKIKDCVVGSWTPKKGAPPEAVVMGFKTNDPRYSFHLTLWSVEAVDEMCKQLQRHKQQVFQDPTDVEEKTI